MQSAPARWLNACRLPAVAAAILLAASATQVRAAKLQHMVPMRDGTRLATDVYLPGAGEGKYPVVFMRGPYGKGPGAAVALAVNGQGCALVVQDMRGRFDSEGSDAVVFMNDGWGNRQDGHDSLAWIAKQPWCNGRVATWGGSALGITQNMLAPGAPDVLKAQHVSVAFSNMYSQAAYQGGVWRKALIERWLAGNRFDPESQRTFQAHPLYDAFWEGANPEAQADRVNAPAVFWGGWYDIFVQGTINSFVTIHNHGGPGARGKCRLILGPWAHGQFQELKYPANSKRTPPAGDVLRFFSCWLNDKNSGVPEDKPVHYYVMGDPEDPKAPGNSWRAADNWPPPSTATNFYFHLDGSLGRDLPTEDGQRTYKYDPNDPVPTVGGQNLNIPKGPMDQRKVESRPDVLLFTTPTLTEPIEVTGRIRARLYVESDCPDTDFTVKLTDVYPDGRSMLLTDGILRARFREGFAKEVFMEPGKVYELTVDLWSTSITFGRGHKIRVAVSSSNDPRFDPNPNTGKPFRADKQTRVATNTLHLSRKHPSHVVLPVYDGENQHAE